MADMKTNLLLGAGAIMLTQTLTLLSGGDLVPSARAADMVLAQAEDGGEGGESGGEGGGEAGGEGGAGVPSSYALNSTDPNKWNYDASAAIETYVTGGAAQYKKAAEDAATMKAAIDALLAAPSQATLDAARQAWIAARPAYLVTEAFRFYDGPIEAIEGQLNAWPMNEAYIDYSKADPKSGLINDPNFTPEGAALVGLNQKSDEVDVTTGWHAIEFLLWGQDFNPNGPGDRPYTDYTAGQGNNDKRRAYLAAVTDLLVADLNTLAAEWAADKYVATFKALPPREAIGRMINGIAVLAGSEFRSERMAVALDSGDQEDEHSCFSDTTYQDFVYDFVGIENVYYGRYPTGQGTGLADIIRALDPAQAQKIDALMADAATKIKALGNPWDQVLASAPDSPARQQAEAAVTALGDLAAGLKAAGTTLGVLVQIPGM